MEWTYQLLEIPLMAGLVFIITGLIMYIFPPKKINSFYGYRTPASMKSQECWEFAQRFSSIRLAGIGIILLISSALGLLINVGERPAVFIGATLTLAAIMFVILSTEKKLKDKFPIS